MDLNEAISHAKEVAESKRKTIKEVYENLEEDRPLFEEQETACLKCAEEHEQLAEWLTELAKRRVEDRWISVKERLPEEKKNPNTNDFAEVLCSTVWGDVRTYKFGKPIGFDESHFWYACGIMDKYVTHWRYLPEPYKESEDK